MKTKQKSLRQLAKELGVSHAYLSQIKNGNRPASSKVVSKFKALDKHNSFKVVSKSGKQKCHKNLVTETLQCYNPDTLGISLAVGQRTLDP